MSTELDNTTLVTPTATEHPLSFFYVISERLFVWLDPIVTVVGVVGNILMLLVVQRKEFTWSPVSVFISALAVADTLVLVLDFINNWLKMALKIYVLSWHPIGCKIYRFLFVTCYTYASWVVVAVSVERVIVVWFPFRAKRVCTRRNAILAVVLIALPIVAMYTYNLWAWDLDAENNCNIAPDYNNFQSYIAPWLNGALYSYIPFIILVVCNAAIVVQLSRSKSKRKALGEERGERKNKDARITRTVCLICLFYLILTTPVALYYVIQFAAGQFIYQGPEMMLAEVVILIFALANHSINIFLYICTSETFRGELLAMVTCKRRGRSSHEHKTSGKSSTELTSVSKTVKSTEIAAQDIAT